MPSHKPSQELLARIPDELRHDMGKEHDWLGDAETLGGKEGGCAPEATEVSAQPLTDLMDHDALAKLSALKR